MSPIPDPPSPYQTDYDPSAPVDGLPPTATIVEIYPAIMREKPDTIRTAAHGWNRLCSGIWSTWHDLGGTGAKLRTQWKSQAAEYFFPYIEGTRASLDEWQNVAYINYTALIGLADTVQDLQGVMREIWIRFSHEQAQNYAAENSGGLGEFTKDTGEALSGDTHRRINSTLERFTNETIQRVLTPFSNAFSSAWSAITVGNKFQGPTDAEKPADGALQRIAEALAPRPGGISAPSMGAAPAVPQIALPPTQSPTLPDRPQPPAPQAIPPEMPPAPSSGPQSQPPSAVPLRPPSTLPLPAPPRVPTTPDTPTAPAPPSRPHPSAPPNPVLAPEIPSRPGIRPAGTGPALRQPGFARAPLPAEVPTSQAGADGAAATLQGRGTVGPSGRVPSVADSVPPPLRGRSTPVARRRRHSGPAEPGRIRFPGAGPGGPSLLGRRGDRTADTPTRVTGFPGAPRQLQGIRRPVRGTGATDAGTLTGRLTPAPVEDTLESAARQALRPGLGGRGRPEPDRRTRATPRADQPTTYVGIDERFEIDRPPAVIDRPAEPAARRTEPALRPSPTDAVRAG